MRIIKLLFIFLITLMYSHTSVASHIMGADITYTYISGNDYLFRLVLYRDCTGITPGSSQNVDFTSNSCGQTFSQTFTQDSIVDVSQVCPGQLTTCNGGSLPGTQAYYYSAIVTMPANCTDWQIYWSTCCRNSAITNLQSPGSAGIFVMITMDNLNYPTNSSPQFSAIPTPYLCVNQSFSYNHGAFDPDGDSLVYSLTQPLDGSTPPGTPIAYNPGYSATNPVIASVFNLNSATGEMCFTPTQADFDVIVIQIQEYRNGVLIGTYRREMQVVISSSCSNSPPNTGGNNVCGGGTFTNISGGPTVQVVDSNSVMLCPGDSVRFQITVSDPDGDNVSLSTNIASSIPGANYTISCQNCQQSVLTFWWTPTALDSGVNVFTVTVQDDACPISGLMYYTYDIYVFDGVTVSPDDTICGSQGAPLQANGGNTFNWTVLSGDPILVGQNFSCNPCANPIATPSVTTTYVVTNPNMVSCMNSDTVTVYVVPDFNMTLTASDSAVCLNEVVQLNAAYSPSGTYTQVWTPASGMNNNTLANPLDTMSSDGDNWISITATSSQGCVKSDSILIRVSPNIKPTINVAAQDTLLNCGLNPTTTLEVQYGNPIPTSCGLSSSNQCAGGSSQITIGNGTGLLGTTTYPAPFGNWYTGARHQMLYLASELSAAGFTAGKITAIAFNVGQINGTTTYNNFEIRMKCTNSNQLTNWESGMVVVAPAQTINITTGWVTIPLTNAYDWDGSSNLIIETCFDLYQGSSNWTSNSPTYYTTTTFNSVLYYRSDAGSVCYGGTPSSSNNRPNILFTVCNASADTSYFAYSWTPNMWINNTTIPNPEVTPQDTITYTVVVTDTLGGCADTASLLINLCCITPNVTTTDALCYGDSSGTITVNPTNISSVVNYNFYITDSVTNTIVDSVIGQPNTTFNVPEGTYLVTVDDGSGCLNDTTVYIGQPDSITLILSQDTTICLTGTATLSATSTGGTPLYSYVWSTTETDSNITVAPMTDTYYSVTVTDNNGCVKTDSILVSLHPPIVVNPIPNDSICPDDFVYVRANATGGFGALNYSWFNNWTGIATGDSLIYQVPADNSNICVVVTDQCETPADTACFTVNWYPVDNPLISIDTNGGCYPVTIRFTPLNHLTDSIVWDMGDGQPSFNSDTAFNYTFTAPDCYDILVTSYSPAGCMVDSLYNNLICAYDYPTVDFIADPDSSDLLNTEVNFHNLSNGGVYYYWYFDYDSIKTVQSTDMHPTYTYPQDKPNDYTVMLVVTNQYNCSDSIMKRVVMTSEYALYVPNSFTPNGDGKNEVFYVLGNSISPEDFLLRIYDRWGHLLFETTDITQGWDGTYQGKLVQTGTYIWDVQVKEMYSPQKHHHTGHVNVLR